MALEELKTFEVRHGGPDLHLEESQFQAIFASYKEQFVRQQSEDGLTNEEISEYLNHVLKEPTTVLLFSNDQLAAIGGIAYFQENPDYKGNEITELGTLAVAHDFRGRNLSEEVLKKLMEEALQRKAPNKGMIFSLRTATPAVVRQADKLNYKPMDTDTWIGMSQTPWKRYSMDKFDYKAYVNWQHYTPDPLKVTGWRARFGEKVRAALGAFMS